MGIVLGMGAGICLHDGGRWESGTDIFLSGRAGL